MSTLSLGDICDFAYGNSLPEERRSGGNVPVYGSNGVVGWHGSAVTSGPTIVIGRKGSIGEIRWSDQPCFPIDTTYYVEATKLPCELRWLYYALLQLDLTRFNKSAAVPGLNREDAYEKRIVFPPLPEQRRIAAQLEAADRLRRTRRYTLELSDSFLPATFRQLFGDPVKNPKGWPVVTVEEAGVVQLGRQRAPKYKTGKYRKPYIRVANVYENEIDLSDLLHMDFGPSDYPAYKLEYGDILLNEGQSTELVGRPAMWRCEIPDCCFQNTLVRFQANRKICDPSYALWLFIRYLKAGEFAKVSSKTSSVAHLGAQRFAEMKFPLPPLANQQHFATLVTQHERLRATQRESLRQAEHLFQALLHRAFASA